MYIHLAADLDVVWVDEQCPCEVLKSVVIGKGADIHLYIAYSIHIQYILIVSAR